MSALQQLARGVAVLPQMGVAIVERLTMFSILFNIYLSTLHDAEFFKEIEGQPMKYLCLLLLSLVASSSPCTTLKKLGMGLETNVNVYIVLLILTCNA